ncbi:MAG: peptide ligase PGM1-related protein, partial [Vulcanococcus sp.]
GLFLAPTGQPLHYRATDNLTHADLRGLLPADLIDIVADADLHYDPARLRGSVFHLLGCLSEYGKLGMTCVGRSAEEAEAVYAGTADSLISRAMELQGRSNPPGERPPGSGPGHVPPAGPAPGAPS